MPLKLLLLVAPYGGTVAKAFHGPVQVEDIRFRIRLAIASFRKLFLMKTSIRLDRVSDLGKAFLDPQRMVRRMRQPIHGVAEVWRITR